MTSAPHRASVPHSSKNTGALLSMCRDPHAGGRARARQTDKRACQGGRSRLAAACQSHNNKQNAKGRDAGSDFEGGGLARDWQHRGEPQQGMPDVTGSRQKQSGTDLAETGVVGNHNQTRRPHSFHSSRNRQLYREQQQQQEN